MEGIPRIHIDDVTGELHQLDATMEVSSEKEATVEVAKDTNVTARHTGSLAMGDIGLRRGMTAMQSKRWERRTDPIM